MREKMVGPGWLEHPTYCFVGSRSIHLSYGRLRTGFPSGASSLSALRTVVNTVRSMVLPIHIVSPQGIVVCE